MIRACNFFRRIVLHTVAAGLLCGIGGSSALSNEGNCRRLEELARQYAGVKLTSSQQQLKRRLIAWYNENCKRTRSAQSRG